MVHIYLYLLWQTFISRRYFALVHIEMLACFKNKSVQNAWTELLKVLNWHSKNWIFDKIQFIPEL